MPYDICQGHRHGFLSGGTIRQYVANLPPKYPKNRKRHRIWATSLSNLEWTSLLNLSLEGTRPLRPPISTPMTPTPMPISPTAYPIGRLSLLRSRFLCKRSMWVTQPCCGGVYPRSSLHWCFTITLISIFLHGYLNPITGRHVIMHASKILPKLDHFSF